MNESTNTQSALILEYHDPIWMTENTTNWMDENNNHRTDNIDEDNKDYIT